MATRARRPALKGGQTRDFSGGPNLRDAPPELAANEVSDSWNVVFDERGGAGSRLGYTKYNGSAFGVSVPVKNVYWSPMLGTTITQAGADLYKGTSTTSVKTFTTNGRVGFAEMAGKVVVGHPVDGLFTSTDGTTWNAVVAANRPTKMDALAVWQNKLWTNDLVGTSPSRVHYSDAGDPTAWTNATQFNDLREKDNEQIVAFHISSGQDILGRPGLLAFKQESFYRIYDSATSAYTTVDATNGAASALAVVGVGARVLFLNKHGIFWWAEGQPGAVNASDRLQPLWQPSQVNDAQLALWCAGRHGTRARFSLTRAGSTANDLAFEYSPDQQWCAPQSNAMSCYTISTGTTETSYGGSASVNGQVYQLDSGGTDDGIAITSRLQTRWLELSAGFQASLWQIRLHGRGSGTVTVRRDYVTGGGDSYPFSLTDPGVTYDSGLRYDTGVMYAVPASQYTQAFYSVGLCRQLSLQFTATTTATVSGTQLLGVGTSPLVGAWALYGIEWLYSPLGLA